MDSKEKEIKELSEKVLRGMRMAFRKLAEERAAKGKGLVVGDMYGNVKTVPAKDLLRTMNESSPD
ncbi:MAG TPA: hypothetical protein VM802_19975 [Chitinophaga sp.]|uniref:hypothetical protein n=1 Tax=Chitinophaga sp. TaxID=1869181 RepID=UPI002B90F228|nr:hypothetical protein [Chitinophaga sp.]HVI47166.1 hypothetical protein [Chitinophaga sp.]